MPFSTQIPDRAVSHTFVQLIDCLMPWSRNRGAEKAPHFAYHGSCLPGAMTQKGRRQQKEWKCGECQRWTWGGSKCWYCGSYGSMEQKGRIFGDAANLESACKEDITATLRHHESLLKSMNAVAPAAARDAIASRIEILKQAIYAKEPFHVQLRERAGSTCAGGGGSGEEAQRGLDCQRGGGQGGPACAEPLATDGRAHGEDLHKHGHWNERRTVELWRMARCW